MQEKIETLLEKNCRYIELNLKNEDCFSIYKPNQGEGNEIAIADGMIQWIQRSDDGCIYENYCHIDEIAYVTGIYDCPEAVEEEEDSDSDV